MLQKCIMKVDFHGVFSHLFSSFADAHPPSAEGVMLFISFWGFRLFGLATGQHIATDISIIVGCFAMDHYAFKSWIRNFAADKIIKLFIYLKNKYNTWKRKK